MRSDGLKKKPRTILWKKKKSRRKRRMKTRNTRTGEGEAKDDE